MKWNKANVGWKIMCGFTLVELLVSFGVLAIIFAISSIVLSTIIPRTSQSAANDVLISDIKGQQALAMSSNSPYGIYFETDSYTLFKGPSFNPNDPSNFVVSLDPSVRFANITFPGNQVTFDPGSGDITGYVQGGDSVGLTNLQTGVVTTVKVNRYGATY